MASDNHASPLVVAYARSLLDLAQEQNQAESIGQELGALQQSIEQVPVFADFLRDPGISENERNTLLEKAFQGRVSPLLWNFLRLLSAKGRLSLLPRVFGAYDALLDERLGKIEADLTVAQRLSDAQLEEVSQGIGKALGKQAVVHQYVDDSIIGGLVLRVGDRVIDASVRQQLRSMRQKMLAARPR